jgi:hypothetical protein
MSNKNFYRKYQDTNIVERKPLPGAAPTPKTMLKTLLARAGAATTCNALGQWAQLPILQEEWNALKLELGTAAYENYLGQPVNRIRGYRLMVVDKLPQWTNDINDPFAVL